MSWPAGDRAGENPELGFCTAVIFPYTTSHIVSVGAAGPTEMPAELIVVLPQMALGGSADRGSRLRLLPIGEVSAGSCAGTLCFGDRGAIQGARAGDRSTASMLLFS